MDRLVGEHILLRKARLTDLDAMHAHVWGDRAVVDTMFLPPSADLAVSADRLVRTIDHQQTQPLFFVALRGTDEAIGLAGMYPESEGVYSEAGIAIGRAWQRRGYAAEALALLLDRAFIDLNARQFAYYCMAHNDASKRLAVRFGFRYDSVKEETRAWDGRTFPVERYVLDREDYLQAGGPI